MPRLCTIRTNVRRRDIDMALFQHATTYREIARTYDISDDAVWRHERNHLQLRRGRHGAG